MTRTANITLVIAQTVPSQSRGVDLPWHLCCPGELLNLYRAVALFVIAFDQSAKLFECPIYVSRAPGFHALDMASVQIVLPIEQTLLQKGAVYQAGWVQERMINLPRYNRYA